MRRWMTYTIYDNVNEKEEREGEMDDIDDI